MNDIYDSFISTKLQEYLSSQEKTWEKTSFWCSDAETSMFDLYHRWIGTPPTNPIEAEKLVMFSSAKMTEMALIERLQEMGLVKKQEGNKQLRIDMERQGIKITGYADGIFVDETPLEVKTFYGEYQAKELKAGKPKSAYLKQLAMYMDFLNAYKGKLIYMDRGTGEMYEFTLVREPDSLKFKCLNVEFDLNETYEKWARLYRNNIVPKIEPSPFENGEYKADPKTIDWSKVRKTDIAKARAGTKVIGSDPENHWKILYSPYKQLLIERQGSKPGYSEGELKQINEVTKGYTSSSWSKK